MNENFIIETKSVSKTYIHGTFVKRKTVALKNVSLSIKKGEIFALVGPNGAGKTTLLNILISLIKPDTGEVWIMEKNVTNKFDNRIKEKMNMCSGIPNFPWCMTVKEILNFYSMIYGIANNIRKKVVNEYIEIFELSKVANVRYDELSTGNKQRLALAKSLLNTPEILLLDEPTLGLDPDIALKTRMFIKKIHQEQKNTIIITSHYMKEIELLCDRVAFIKNGQIFTIGTIEELKQKTNTDSLEEVFLEMVK